MTRRSAGFTLIELLVVMAITAILFTIGYLSFQSYSRQQTLLAAVRTVQTDLRLAQGNATSSNKPSGCVDVLNGYKFLVTSSNTYEVDAFCGASTNISVKNVTMPDGITIGTPAPNPILFKILGQGTNISSGATAVILVTQSITSNAVSIVLGANGSIIQTFGTTVPLTPSPSPTPSSTPNS